MAKGGNPYKEHTRRVSLGLVHPKGFARSKRKGPERFARGPPILPSMPTHLPASSLMRGSRDSFSVGLAQTGTAGWLLRLGLKPKSPITHQIPRSSTVFIDYGVSSRCGSETGLSSNFQGSA